jgi:hypothetical protein
MEIFMEKAFSLGNYIDKMSFTFQKYVITLKKSVY